MPDGSRKSLPVMPKTRGDCANVPRPCPFRQCRYNMVSAPYSDKTKRGGTPPLLSPEQRRCVTRMRRGGKKVAEIAAFYGVSSMTIYKILRGRRAPAQSCALDVADEGAHTQAEVADAMGVTPQWVRDIEGNALIKLRRALARGAGGIVIGKSNVSDYFEDGPVGWPEPEACEDED